MHLSTFLAEHMELSALLLRVWMFIVTGGAFFGSILGFFSTKYVRSKQFNLAPEAMVSHLAARLFGVWTTLAGCVRLLYVLYPNEPAIILATMASFLIVFTFYSNEIFAKRTISLRAGVGILFLSGMGFRSVGRVLIRWSGFCLSWLVSVHGFNWITALLIPWKEFVAAATTDLPVMIKKLM